MDLFLTMAGEYSRFKKEGYQIPKFLLPWGHRTILSELLNQFMDYKFDNVYLIMHKKDMDYYNHIQKTCDYYTSGNFKIIVIDDTNSQSETLLRGIEQSNSQNKFIVHNIDTLLYNRDYLRINNELNNADGYIDLFSSQNHKYSYVLRDNNIITNISEKILISNEATSGLYGFSSTETYCKYYVDGYISQIYDKMIKDDNRIVSGDVHNDNDTIVLGTPHEYTNLVKLKLR